MLGCYETLYQGDSVSIPLEDNHVTKAGLNWLGCASHDSPEETNVSIRIIRGVRDVPEREVSSVLDGVEGHSRCASNRLWNK